MIIIFILVFLIYTTVNYYIFRKGWQVLAELPKIKPLYAIAFIITSYGYILAEMLDEFLSPFLYDIIYTIGAFWFPFLVYFIFLLLLLDLIRFIEKRFHFLPKVIYTNYKLSKRITAFVIIICVCVIVFLGYLNKNDLTVRTLFLSIPKGDSKINELNIVMASDLHLSIIDGERSVSDIVNKINSLNPDLVLLAGDIVDDKAEILSRKGIGDSFKRLKPVYGVYAINGNHEFINSVEPADRYLESFNINILRDRYELIDSSFYIIGREDIAMHSFSGKDRKTLEQIVKTINTNHPKILLDHTPFKLEQAMNNRINLQLSGHTHNGQMWPFNFITEAVYEISWGYLKKGNTHFYVSSGASIWGPPVRTGSRSEVVNVKIKFN